MPTIKPTRTLVCHVYPGQEGEPGKVYEANKNIERLNRLAQMLKERKTVVLVEANGALVPRETIIKEKSTDDPIKGAVQVQLETSRELHVQPDGEVVIRECLNNEAPGWLKLLVVFDKATNKPAAIVDAKGKQIRLV